MVQETTAKNSESSKPPFWQLTLAGLATILTVGGVAVLLRSQPQQPKPNPIEQVSVPEIKSITALGRLEPKGEIIQLSAPTAAEGSRIEELLVKEGSKVKAGQIIAILDSRDRTSAALAEAEEKVRVASANLTRVKAGAKTGEILAQQAAIARIDAERRNDIEAQKATVQRLEAELNNTHIEEQRHQKLYDSGAISTSLLDSKRLDKETAQSRVQEAKANLERVVSAQQQQLNEAKATLTRIAEVRDVDVAVATAELNAAIAAVKRAQTDLDKTYVKAPQNGQVLEIHTRPGELVGDRGIAEIAETSQMYAIAEVYESDVSKVRVGQKVRISSDSIAGELQGSVEHVGLQILRQNVINTDPSANIDARIVEVKVKLDEASSRKVASFTNLQVKVEILL
jgi:HlyD family secretion protein